MDTDKYDIVSNHNWSSIINFFSENEAGAFDLFYEELNKFMSLSEYRISERLSEYKKLSERWMEYKEEYWK